MTDNYEQYKKEIYNPETGLYDQYFLEIAYDSDSETPRSWDNLTKMIFFHKKYNLGDDHNIDVEDYANWEEMEDALREEYKPVYLAYVSMYDHSGIRIYIGKGSGWDCGIIGFVLITEEDLKNCCGNDPKYRDEKWLEKAAEEEIEIYNHYVQGEVFGYRTYVLKHCPCCNHRIEEDLDSCCGFLGDNWEENGLLDNAGWDKFSLHTQVK